LNIDGEMIGVNVAVRAGAQGIGFAIPIDDALRVSAGLLNVQRLQSKWHGLITEPAADPDAPLRVVRVETASPAEAAGLQPGDEILQVGQLHATRPLDLERALLDRPVGEPLTFRVRRNHEIMNVDLALASSRNRGTVARAAATDYDAATWNVFGLKLSEEPKATFARRSTQYRGGMRVEEVRSDSPAARQGILTGDVLVGMHGWETASAQDVQYIVSRPDLADQGKLKFFLLRGQNTLYQGFLTLTPSTDVATRQTSRR
jgi:serine protease Do